MTPAPLLVELALPAPQRATFFGNAPLAAAVEALQDYVVALAADLDLPVAPQVSMREATIADRFIAGERFKLLLGGSRARVALEAEGAAPAVDGVATVALAVFENRALLVRDCDLPRFRERLHDRWNAVADDALLSALRGLARLCVSSARLADGAGTGSLEQACEQSHDAALGLEVQHPPWIVGIGDLARGAHEIAGVPLPPIAFGDADLPLAAFRLRLNDAWMPTVKALPGPWIDRQLRRHLELFVGGSLVDFLMASLSRYQGPLVTRARERFDRATLVTVFRSVVAEGLSLANLRGALETMLVAHGRTGAGDATLLVLPPHTGGMLPVGRPVRAASPLSALELAELVRAGDPHALRTELMTTASERIPVILSSESFEADLLAAPADEPDRRDAILRRVAAPLGSSGHADGSPRVIVVSSGARLALHRLIELEFPSVRVVSWSELPDNLDLAAEATIQ